MSKQGRVSQNVMVCDLDFAESQLVGAISSCTTTMAVASFLFNVQSAVGADGDTPPTHEVQQQNTSKQNTKGRYHSHRRQGNRCRGEAVTHDVDSTGNCEYRQQGTPMPNHQNDSRKESQHGRDGARNTRGRAGSSRGSDMCHGSVL